MSPSDFVDVAQRLPDQATERTRAHGCTCLVKHAEQAAIAPPTTVAPGQFQIASGCHVEPDVSPVEICSQPGEEREQGIICSRQIGEDRPGRPRGGG